MVVILVKERTAEAVQTMVAIVTVSASTTAKETAGMTLEAEAEAQGITEAEVKAKEAEENPIAKAEEVNHVSIETTDLQKGQVEAVDAAATISVNRATIILADELICAAS